MKQILMIVTAEGCQEWTLSEELPSFEIYITEEQVQAEKISLYQKEGVWNFCANTEGFLKTVFGQAATSFRLGEQKIWEYTDKLGQQMVFLTFGKKQRETRFQYYTLGDKEEITIGKGGENTISYDCMGLVSNCHGVGKWVDGMWVIHDTSKNGIFAENRRIWKQKKLGYGDSIEIFGLKIVFLGRIIGVENREQVHVHMEKHDWWEKEEVENEADLLQDGIEILPLSDYRMSEGVRGGRTQIPMVSFEGNRKKHGERGEKSTLFFAIGPIRMVYDGTHKKQRSYEMQQLAFWKEEQKEKIVNAYDKERKNWLIEQRSVFSWMDSACWREEIWNQKNDNLWITFGMGKRKSEIGYSMESSVSEKEKEEVNKLLELYQWQEQVPVGIRLLDCKQLEIVGETAWWAMYGILMEIVSAIPYTKLRIVCLTKKENPVARDIRWLPHVWSDNQEYRYYATDKKNISTLFSKLEKEKENRHTLVLVEERTWLDEIQWQYKCEKDGYSFWILVDNPKNCSKLCGQRLMIWKDFAALFRGETLEQEFVPQYMEKERWKQWLRKLNPLRIGKLQQTHSGEIEMFHIYTKERREKNVVLERWKSNLTKDGICACIGLDETEAPVFLNIQEKQQGPHGLIAGTTGAGKSIFLQTFVLSLAMEYSPEQLEFVLIDYKGGDMAAPLSTLPHVVGTLTNLHPQLLKRGLSAIQSEIEERQNLLAEQQFSHIDYYNEQMERKGEKVVPHLCIVVDEFAELTTDAPYFLEGLLKVSRVGRSLGIHLILATQKPAGTVTEHIWTNSRFRLCFMVQSKKDSLEMLHKKDAAGISTPGEAFLQIGANASLTKIRVAHAGALVKLKSGVSRLLEDGTKAEEQNQSSNLFTQREVLVSLLSECAREFGIYERKQLWMPLLSERITRTQSQQWQENCIWLGWCDLPKKQKQIPLLIEERQFGNIAILGEVGRGKTTCLKTIVWELAHNSFEQKQWIFICDFDGEFRKEETFPWIGAIVRNGAEVEKLMYFLEGEYEKRREDLRNHHPTIWVLIDHMEAMREQMTDCYMEELSMFVREGKKYGIYFVLLAQSYGIHGIPSVWKANMVHQLVFFENKEEKNNCYPQMNLPESTSRCPGRGLTTVEGAVVEFQGTYMEEEKYKDWIQSALKEEKETPFVLLPETLNYGDYLQMEKKCTRQKQFSIGCKELDGSVFWLPLQGMEHFIIVGKGKVDYEIPLCMFLMQLKKNNQSCLLFGKNQSKTVKFAEKQGILVIEEKDWEQEDIHIEDFTWVFVEDFSNWVIENGNWMLQTMQNKKEITWVVVCQAEEFRMLRKYPVFRYMLERQQGIYIGSGIREQSFFDTGIFQRTWENYMEQQEIGVLFWDKKMQLVHFPNVEN